MIAHIDAVGLPAELHHLNRRFSAERLIGHMRRDKKAHHDLTFVLDGPEGVVPVSGVSEEAVIATLNEMGAGS